MDPDSIRARIDAATQERLDAIIRTESELQVYGLEDVRQVQAR